MGAEEPTAAAVDASISAFARLGVKVMITELDVDMLPGTKGWGDADIRRREAADPAFDPYAHGFPAGMQDKLAQRYADLFRVFVAHRATISRVTFWGVTDGDSWLNDFPISGRTSYPLLFDRSYRAKPALDAVLRVVRAGVPAAGP
jgi:endo-1,4-beta-xylanase